MTSSAAKLVNEPLAYPALNELDLGFALAIELPEEGYLT